MGTMHGRQPLASAILSAALIAAATYLPSATAWSAAPNPTRRACRRRPPLPPLRVAASNDRVDEVRGLSSEEAGAGGDRGRVEIPDNSAAPSALGRPLGRRDAIASSLSSAAVTAATLADFGRPDTASAIDLPDFLLPRDRRSDGGVYKPGKRATAYLVDSTIPPSLVPYRPSREAAILKGLGAGSGTPKAAYLAERITLNNMMNKAVFGAGKVIADVARGGVEDPRSGPGYSSFVFIGVDYASGKDAALSERLLTDIVKPRSRGAAETALGFAFVPRSVQATLNGYSRGEVDESTLIKELASAEADQTAVESYLPLMRFARGKGLTLLALAPETKDVVTVRKEGLQNVDVGRRSDYVADSEGFVNLTQDPKFRLYTERSLLKDFVPVSADDAPGDFFAERIMVHEAVATAAARWSSSRPDSLVIALATIPDLRFMGGPNRRIPRVSKFFNPNSIVDDDAVTTILLNPSAATTLSLSKFLRLEIGTAPKNIEFQTKVADYFWFSDMPKVNMLPRMMNYA